MHADTPDQRAARLAEIKEEIYQPEDEDNDSAMGGEEKKKPGSDAKPARTPPALVEMRTAFLAGMSSKWGDSSTVRALKEHPLFDANAVKLMFEFASPRVLVLYSAPADRARDVCASLVRATGGDMQVDTFDGGKGTPDVNHLLQYDCIFTFSFSVWENAELLGNNLAAFAESGRGGVVLTNYTNCIYHENQRVRGNFEQYHALQKGTFLDGVPRNVVFSEPKPEEAKSTALKPINQAVEGELVERVYPHYEDGRTLHPLVYGAKSFNGGPDSIRCSGQLREKARLIQSWDDNLPMIAYTQVPCTDKQKGGVACVTLNLYPVSNLVKETFWDANTDGHVLLWAAAVFAATHRWYAPAGEAAGAAAGSAQP